jgi:hydrogenase/urease accessory protein HupE
MPIAPRSLGQRLKTRTASPAFAMELGDKVVIQLNGPNRGRIICVVCLLLCLSSNAWAHDPGLSAAEVRISGAMVVVHLSIARTDFERVLALDGNNDEQLTSDELVAASEWLERFARDGFEIWFADHLVAPTSVVIGLEEASTVDFLLRFDRQAGSQIKFRAAAIKSLARGHRQYVSVVDERGNKLSEKILNASVDEFELDISSSPPATSILQFIGLGLEHILTGYDHLIFLLGLLIAGGGFKDAAKIITSFTVAHSFTLALSTFDLVRVPADVVEPLIAVSIVYVGVENIFRRDLKWRWLLTFGFGLIHGFGFASVLRDLGIGSGAQAALPLVSFNLGVESGQLVIAAIVLPLIWGLRKRPVFVTRLAPVCSILISVAGGFWLVERLLGK